MYASPPLRPSHWFTILLVICFTAVANAQDVPPAGSITLTTKFPGGNARIESNNPGQVKLAPDTRGDSEWFYWCIEATATQPGRVHFVLPEKVAGFKNGGIGFQGPAISEDAGKTWRWLGTETVKENAFHFDFTKKDQTVRFAVTIPYLESNLRAFLKAHEGNKHLTQSVLTKSRHGREVELLQIGKQDPQKKTILLTARHHACETIASYVLEGMLKEALSDSDQAKALREKHVILAVPFVDKDGVEEGDQGKNRKPHDHNRDYIEKSIYPEVQAIKALDAKSPVQYAIDLHCPTLVMQDHQVMYFVGAIDYPAFNHENTKRFAEQIKKSLPKNAPFGPLVWLRKEEPTTEKNSRYFAIREGVILSVTLEIPFAPPGKLTDADSCRGYGAAILRAFVETTFKEQADE